MGVAQRRSDMCAQITTSSEHCDQDVIFFVFLASTERRVSIIWPCGTYKVIAQLGLHVLF